MSVLLVCATGATPGRAHGAGSQDRAQVTSAEQASAAGAVELPYGAWPAADRALSGTIYTVTTTLDAGGGSLRKAIEDANANPGADEIRFNIPGAGAHTIVLVVAIPKVTDTVTIDATSEPGFSGVPLIEIDGSLAGQYAKGMWLAAPGCVVRGLVMNRFDGPAITIDASNCVVAGNYLGTDVSGSVASPCMYGVLVDGGTNATIGGTSPGSRNVISGNEAGVSIGTNGNRVQGNYIGTNAAGNAAVPNTYFGVRLLGANANTIGGTTAAARNVVSGNGDAGIVLFDAANNLIQGNYIGLKANGTGALGNGGAGILFDTSIYASVNNTVGGTTQSAGNSIAQNGGPGVSMAFNPAATGNAILSNSIFANGALGIDLGADGVTLDDAGDGDAGANGLQNFPVLTSATSSGGVTTIVGTINSTPNTTLTIQFFHSPGGDPTTYGEGRYYLGYKTVTTNSSGNATFTAPFSVATSAGHVVAATATSAANNTSEFSQTRVIS